MTLKSYFTLQAGLYFKDLSDGHVLPNAESYNLNYC